MKLEMYKKKKINEIITKFLILISLIYFLDQKKSEANPKKFNSNKILKEQIKKQTQNLKTDKNRLINILEERLVISKKIKNLEEMKRLANEILELDSKNLNALKTLRNIKKTEEKKILDDGKNLLFQKKYFKAINMFKKIPQSSFFFSEANNLIAQADQYVQIKLTMNHASELMKTQNWEGALILLSKSLLKDPKNLEIKKKNK